MKGILKQLQRELQITSIVVTHDMNSAYKIADRIVMLLVDLEPGPADLSGLSELK